MKLKDSFFYTLREVKDEESKSGKLLVRSGMIKKCGSGIYMVMPLGLKVLKNIEKIVREEMNKAGANELIMPSLIPEEYYVNSGRRNAFGNDMFSLKDRYNRDYVLGPTHEELFVEAAKMKIRSYKDMPFTIYQIANKYRDEPRPRLGLIRVREFVMKDAYSFDKDYEGLEQSYQKMFKAYQNVFDRLKLDYRIVKADTGAMGGLLSEEFQAVTDIGEDILVMCDCGYASNLEVSTCKFEKQTDKLKEKELVLTENKKTIDEVSEYLKISKDKIVKTLVYKVKDELIAVLVKGDREVNELKLSKVLKVSEDDIILATDEDLLKANLFEGFVGPIDIKIPIILDEEVEGMVNFVVGANKINYHYLNVNINDFEYKVYDIKTVKENDLCPNCGGRLYFKKGIEVGNTFKLGTKYSEKLGLNFSDENNKLNSVIMGCYGIGLGRTMAAIAEQTSDDKGLNWPIEVAPFKVGIITASLDQNIIDVANKLYDDLNKENIETLLDDRDERIGVKFNDFDLIGIPYRIVIGKKLNEGLVEVKRRNDNESENVKLEDIKDFLINKLK